MSYERFIDRRRTRMTPAIGGREKNNGPLWQKTRWPLQSVIYYVHAWLSQNPFWRSMIMEST